MRIYASKGFELVVSSEHGLFGPTLTGETWQRDLY